MPFAPPASEKSRIPRDGTTRALRRQSDVMSLSSFLSRRFLRIPLLAGTVIATVATSEPGWMLTDSTDPRSLHLDAGATVDTNVELDGSHAVSMSVAIDNAVARTGKLRIETLDSRPECTEPTKATFESDDGIWRVVQDDPKASRPGSQLHHIDFHAHCFAPGKTATVKIRFVNEGETPLDFDWKATAEIRGNESDDAPGGAFVHVKVKE